MTSSAFTPRKPTRVALCKPLTRGPVGRSLLRAAPALARAQANPSYPPGWALTQAEIDGLLARGVDDG